MNYLVFILKDNLFVSCLDAVYSSVQVSDTTMLNRITKDHSISILKLYFNTDSIGAKNTQWLFNTLGKSKA